VDIDHLFRHALFSQLCRTVARRLPKLTAQTRLHAEALKYLTFDGAEIDGFIV